MITPASASSALLGYLGLYAHDRALPRTRIAGNLWPDVTEARARRNLAEAQAQDAAPIDSDLALALDVTERTIERDMAALRTAGTRRRKSSP